MPDERHESADRIDVGYVAHLARLHLTEPEREEFQRQLDRIIGYFQDLKALDVSGVEPTAHAVRIQNVYRRDEVRPGLDPERVFANAPSHAERLFIVPRIVE